MIIVNYGQMEILLFLFFVLTFQVVIVKMASKDDRLLDWSSRRGTFYGSWLNEQEDCIMERTMKLNCEMLEDRCQPAGIVTTSLVRIYIIHHR